MTETDPLTALASIAGRWSGDGQGLWAADPPFRYREEVEFVALRPGLLAYQQRTWGADDGRPRHAETGYLRTTAGGQVEFMVTQPTGITEVHSGTFDGMNLVLSLCQLGRSPTALAVTDVERRLRFVSERLDYTVRLAMNGEVLADHLRAELRRG